MQHSMKRNSDNDKNTTSTDSEAEASDTEEEYMFRRYGNGLDPS